MTTQEEVTKQLINQDKDMLDLVRQLFNLVKQQREYNYGYTYNSLWDDGLDELETTGVPEQLFEACIEQMDKLSDNMTDGTIKMKAFRKGVKSINERLRQYNVRVLKKLSAGSRTDIDNELLYLHAHDMFENIEGSKQNAN